MESIAFQVSAKTARLIGRENVSDVDGAIVELIKNGYDADADCVFIKYVNPYNSVPTKLSLSEANDLFGNDNVGFLNEFYHTSEGFYVINEDVKDNSKLEAYIKGLSSIIVIDNGNGMTLDILKSAWMSIGTDNKEKDVFSPVKKRVKTGAKGIGRFALDKLSLKSQVYTHNKTDDTYKWEIDWQQFEKASLLNQVYATLTKSDVDFKSIIMNAIGDDFEIIKDYKWDTGTMIVLSPIRDFLTDKSYKKVNKNIETLNPLGNVDRFDVFVRNNSYPEFDYSPKENTFSRENYDYLIEANYDGKDTVYLKLDRNEIDIDRKVITVEYSPTNVEKYDLNEFWDREAFKNSNYHREDFNGIYETSYTLKEILASSKTNPEIFSKVGPFSLKLFYLKNSPSTVGITKSYKTTKRKEILSKFSGIKIYRDSFKVRPYGDEGQLSDWLNLGERAINSPAAGTHDTGRWRVSPNQIIGSVSISRFNNSKLEDNANREGMIPGEEYDAFVELITGIINRFELDRQYPLREFGIWYRNKIKAHKDRAQEVYEAVIKERGGKEGYAAPEGEERSDGDYSEEDLKDAVYTFGKEHEQKDTLKQLIMLLASSGVLAETFSHELKRIGTDLGTRGSHLKASIDRLLEFKPYTGDEDFNPYDQLEELNATDTLLSQWVDLIMDSIKHENFSAKEIYLRRFLVDFCNNWGPLLEKKHISIDEIVCDENVTLNISEMDLYLLFNNFILNSAYFLEEAENEKSIFFYVKDDTKNIIIEMKNNGPRLAEQYRKNPDESLLPLVSSKEKGTGLGLWIASNAVYRNNGEIHVVDIPDGYLLKATFKR